MILTRQALLSRIVQSPMQMNGTPARHQAAVPTCPEVACEMILARSHDSHINQLQARSKDFKPKARNGKYPSSQS
eukprot:2305339-Amphidinium_carterae.1